MKTPNLLDVPKMAPSKRERINEFKRVHGIVTHRVENLARQFHPWTAIHLPSARKFGYGVTETSDFMDCVAKVGRLLEEAGVFVTGETEIHAIRELSKNVGINNAP